MLFTRGCKSMLATLGYLLREVFFGDFFFTSLALAGGGRFEGTCLRAESKGLLNSAKRLSEFFLC
jgi:hypothetical protein